MRSEEEEEEDKLTLLFYSVAAAALPRTHPPRPCRYLSLSCSSAASPAALSDVLSVVSVSHALAISRVLSHICFVSS